MEVMLSLTYVLGLLFANTAVSNKCDVMFPCIGYTDLSHNLQDIQPILVEQIDSHAFQLYFAESSCFIEHSLDIIYVLTRNQNKRQDYELLVLSNHCCETAPENTCK